MGFACEKCNKILSSRQRLEQHLKKTVPCDLRCRDCDEKLLNRSAYYRHECGDEPLELEPFVETDLSLLTDKNFPIPLSDITSPEYINQLTKYARDNDCEVVLERITIKPLKERQKEQRIMRLSKSVTTNDFSRALMCLEKTEANELRPFVVNNLEMMHGDANRKDLQSIKLSDKARKNVKICTRRDNDECKWLNLPRIEAVNHLSSHSMSLLSTFLIETIPKLSKCAFKLENEIIPCLALMDETNFTDEVSGFVVYEEFDDPNSLKHLFGEREEFLPDLRVRFNHRIRLCPIQSPLLDDLYDKAQQRKNEIVEMLKKLVLTEKDLTPFLQKTCGFI